jgi:hypothetical protein
MAKGHPYQLGENYFVRTVTYHFTGRLAAVYAQELVFTDSAWIASDGRFADAISKGVYDEVEPFPDNSRVIIGRGSVIDAVAINTPLPRVQK